MVEPSHGRQLSDQGALFSLEFEDSAHIRARQYERKMTKEEMDAEVKKFEDELISPKEAAMRSRGASNAGYHYLGCGKTFALMGKAFAERMLELMGD